MIIVDLQCPSAHRFEGWYKSSDILQAQLDDCAIECPFCASRQIIRLPSGPRIMRARDDDSQQRQGSHARQGSVPDSPAVAVAALRRMVRESEDVGTRFFDEARSMHDGVAPKRSIRGQATIAETRELLEEGIEVLPLPKFVTEESH